MKKLISLFLATVMLISCMSVFNVSAADEEGGSVLDDILNDVTNMENFENSVIGGLSGFIYPENADYEVDVMIENGEIEGEMLGISVDFLYNSRAPLYWNNVAISKDDLSLAKANINLYLQRILKEKYGGFNLFSMAPNEYGIPYASYYATEIANFLGNMFYPDFEEVTISFSGTEEITSDEFYSTIVDKSGFGLLVHNNWCQQGRIDFRPVIEVWGLDCDNVLKSEFLDGYRLAKKLIPAVINKFLSEGPVNAMLDIIRVYSRSYDNYLYDSTAALFSLKIAAGIIDPSELQTMHGLFNLVVNNNNPDDTTKLQFVTMPTERFKLANDTTELFLYLLVYSNINTQYKNNEEVVENLKAQCDDEVIRTILDVLLKGELTGIISYLTELFAYNMSQVPNDLMGAIKQALANFFKKVVTYFDNLFKMLSGEKEFPRWD